MDRADSSALATRKSQNAALISAEPDETLLKKVLNNLIQERSRKSTMKTSRI
jgi:hypothetical protein